MLSDNRFQPKSLTGICFSQCSMLTSQYVSNTTPCTIQNTVLYSILHTFFSQLSISTWINDSIQNFRYADGLTQLVRSVCLCYPGLLHCFPEALVLGRQVLTNMNLLQFLFKLKMIKQIQWNEKCIYYRNCYLWQ